MSEKRKAMASVPVKTSKQKRRIGELLIESGVISPSELKEALALQAQRGGKTVENLISLKYMDSDSFLDFLARQKGMASIDLENYAIPRDVLTLIPSKFSIEHQCLPVDKMGHDLTVAMACPLDAATIKKLENTTGCKIRTLLVSLNALNDAFIYYYSTTIKNNNNQQADGEQTATEAQIADCAVTFTKILHLVRRLESLPALPETVEQLRNKIHDPDTSITDIAAIIERDPALSARVLGLANSSAFALPHRVDSVQLATSLLGLREVYSIVLSSAVIDYFDAARKFNYKAFWKHSLFCAATARELAKRTGISNIHMVFSAGLLHDFGRLIFAEVLPQHYSKIDQGLPRTELIEKENQFFGVAHPELGYILASQWKFPEEICDTIRFHHEIANATQNCQLVAVVSLASALTDAYVLNGHELPDCSSEECSEAMKMLGLHMEDINEVLDQSVCALEAESIE